MSENVSRRPMEVTAKRMLRLLVLWTISGSRPGSTFAMARY
jgi:hypothetical protein